MSCLLLNVLVDCLLLSRTYMYVKYSPGLLNLVVHNPVVLRGDQVRGLISFINPGQPTEPAMLEAGMYTIGFRLVRWV